MNLKALITTLVLGSSSAAMADSITLSGSVKVNVGAPVAHQPVVADDCNDNLPAPRPVAQYTSPHRPVVVAQPAPQVPVYRGPFYNPTNTTVGKSSSQYKGWIAKSPMSYRMTYGKAMWRTPTATTWFDLTEATRIDSNREFFTLGADKGLFKAIKLQALGAGRSNIKQVAIELIDANGKISTQKVRFDTWIDARTNPALTIDLEGDYRQINRIIVYGSTDRGSALKLLAM